MKDPNLLERISLQDYYTLDDVYFKIMILAFNEDTDKIFAEKAGISQQYLSDLLRKRRKPGKKILNFLKLKPVTIYKQERK